MHTLCIICYSNIPLDGIIKLTEAERDNIDSEAMKYMKLCNETLNKYKSEGKDTNIYDTNR